MLFSPELYCLSFKLGVECFNPLKRVYAFLTLDVGSLQKENPLKYFNPLKRVYAFLTASLLMPKNKNQKNSFHFPFNNQISPLLIYRLFENKMFGDNLQYITKKHPHFHCKNTPIVPPHSGDSLPGFSHLPRLSPNPKIRKKHNHNKTYQIFLYATQIRVILPSFFIPLQFYTFPIHKLFPYPYGAIHQVL